jgi:hypothetical protein
MKVLLLASLLISASAMACPDLQGTYAFCKNSQQPTEGSKDVVITQHIRDKATVYNIEETDIATNQRTKDELTADGNFIPQTDEQTGVSTLSRTFCEGDILVTEAQVTFQGQDVGSVRSEMVKDSHKINIKMVGTVLGQAVNIKETCE